MKPLIGITAGEVYNRDFPWSPVTYGQSFTYVDAVIAAGGSPVILPLTENEDVLLDIFNRLDGIVLAGGNDLRPALYGAPQHETVKDASLKRDSVEMVLLKASLQARLPILAICRGMQLINVHFGGTLWQHIPDDLPDAQDHRLSSKEKDIEYLAHTLQVAPDSLLARIAGSDPLPTNTHHHQAIRTLGNGIVATAWAEDGVIEAIELPELEQFLVAVQSHPESLLAAEPRWRAVFEAFVRATNHTPTAAPEGAGRNKS